MMTASASNHIVRHFREVLFWPVQLMPLADGGDPAHWELLAQDGEGNQWRRLKDRFHAGELDFEERHYKEFVTFLPYVQRFIYGESHSHVSHDAERSAWQFGDQDIPAARGVRFAAGVARR